MSEPTVALVTGANKGIGYEIAAGLGARGWRVGQHDHELVPAEAAPDVAAPQHVLQPRADVRQDLVAAEVADAIVDRLEPVDVEHHDRQRRARPAGAPQFALENLDDVPAVEALRERVGERVAPGLGEQLHVADGDADERRSRVQQARRTFADRPVFVADANDAERPADGFDDEAPVAPFDNPEGGVRSAVRARREHVPAAFLGDARHRRLAGGLDNQREPRGFTQAHPELAAAGQQRQVPPDRRAHRVFVEDARQGPAERGQQLEIDRALFGHAGLGRGSRRARLHLLPPRVEVHDQHRHENDQRRQQPHVIGRFHLRGELEDAPERLIEDREQRQREAREEQRVVLT